MNKRVVESLIRAGAMDSLAGTRSQLFAIIEEAMESGQRAQKDRDSGQAGLFGDLLGGGGHDRQERDLPNVPDWTGPEKLRGEKETIGFYVTGHPLDEWDWKVSELAKYDSETIGNAQRGEEVALCGVLTGVTRRRNKEQKPWAFMQLDDKTGSTEVLVFPGKWDELQGVLQEDTPVLVRGKAMPEEDGSVKINASAIISLENARVDLPTLISIRIRLAQSSEDRARELMRLFQAKPGKTSVRLKIEKPRDFVMVLDVDSKVLPDREFKAEVERICGPESLEVIAS